LPLLVIQLGSPIEPGMVCRGALTRSEDNV
jgi:hypothetical protein